MHTAANPRPRSEIPAAEHGVCLLHADYHPMAGPCWGAILDWYADHKHLNDRERFDAYQAEVERRMLDTLVAKTDSNPLG